MAVSMYCTQCDCGCFILPLSCLYKKQGRLKSIGIENKPEILNSVNTFILIGDSDKQGILGQQCFDELCSDILRAESEAQEYRSNNDNAEGPQTEFWYYLTAKWKNVLENSHFQNMYAAYCMYYYYFLFIAASDTTKSGDVRINKTGAANDGEGSNSIDDEANKRRTANARSMASRYAGIFKSNYLDKNKSLYPCLPKECKNCGCYHTCSDQRYCDSCLDLLSDNKIKEPPQKIRFRGV